MPGAAGVSPGAASAPPDAAGGRIDGGGEAKPARPADIYRSALALVAWWVWLAFAVANLVDLAVQGRDRVSVQAAAALLLVTGIAYVAAFRPRVIAAADGIVVRNPLRDHRVPWAAVTDVELRDLLRVHCAWQETPDRHKMPNRPSWPNRPNKGQGPQAVWGPESVQRTRVIQAWAIQAPRRAGMVTGMRPAFGRDDFGRRSVGGGAAAAESPGSVHRQQTERIARALGVRARRERADEAARVPGTREAPVTREASVTHEAAVSRAARPVSAWYWPAGLAIVVPALLLVAAICA